MSRNLIVGLAVLVVAVLAWIAIDAFDDGSELADAQVDAPLTTATEDDAVVVEMDPDNDPTSNEAEVVSAATDGAEAEAEVVVDGTERATDSALEGGVPVESATDNANGIIASDEEIEAATVVEGTEAASEDALVAIEEEAETAAAATGEALETTGAEIADTAEATADAVAGATVEATEELAEGTEELEGTESLLAETDAEVVEVPVEGTTADAQAPLTAGDIAVADLPALLTEEGFDPDILVTYVEGSDLDDPTKVSLTDAIEDARDDPTALPTLREQMETEFEIQ
jgi:hypothetical protein